MKSMTGYGSARGSIDSGIFSIDVRTLNHRYCEIVVRNLNSLGPLESLIRQEAQKYFGRGRIEISVNEELPAKSSRKFQLDINLAKEHRKIISKLAKLWNVKSDDLLQKVDPAEYIKPISVNVSQLKWWKLLRPLVHKSFRQVIVMRKKEGKILSQDLKKRLKNIEKAINKLIQESKRSILDKRSVLKERYKSYSVEKGQVLQEEIAMMNRHDVTEELTRMKSHLVQFKKLLLGELIGRKLDFLLQEMNREVTTLGSKICDGKASQIVVECKAELERLREQVQNIE